MANNAKNNGKKRSERVPGVLPVRVSGLAGPAILLVAPRTCGLVNALRVAVVERLPDGRTVEEALAQALIEEALEGKHRLAAINSIYDRLEGKPLQSLNVRDEKSDQIAELMSLSKEELLARKKVSAAEMNDLIEKEESELPLN